MTKKSLPRRFDLRKIRIDDSAARLAEAKRFNMRLAFGLSALALMGTIFLITLMWNAWASQTEVSKKRLETYSELRVQTLERYLTSLEVEVRIWSEHASIVEDARHFIKNWRSFSTDDIESLRQHFIYGGPPPKSGNVLVEDYLQFHDKIHPGLDAFNTHHGYYDIFIFDREGNLVYSVEKEDDFGFNFSTAGSKYSDTGLGEAFRRALAANNPEDVVFIGFEPYAPSNDDAAAFLSSQIIDEQSEIIGVYAIQIPTNRINAILQNAEGLGQTGQTYLVGADFLMRNQSRLTDEKTSLVVKIDNAAVRAALDGQIGFANAVDILGEPSIAYAWPLNFKDARYAVGTEIQLKDSRAALRPYWIFCLLAFTGLLVFCALGYFILKAKLHSQHQA